MLKNIIKQITRNPANTIGVVGIVVILVSIVAMATTNTPFTNTAIFFSGVSLLMAAGFMKEARGELK